MKYKNKIFIFGHYGLNVGDNAMLYALLEEISKSIQSAEFVIPTRNKEIYHLPQIRNNIIYIGFNPLKFFNEIKNSSIFLVGGGTHFYDYGPRFERLIISLQQYSIFIFAKIFCKKIYFIGTGIEIPTKIWGKFLLKYIHKLPDFTLVRDSNSYKILENMKIKNKKLSFDLAALLKLDSIITNESNESVTLGVSILPFFDTKYGFKKEDKLLVKQIAKDLKFWLENNSKNKIKLYIFSSRAQHGDVSITKSLEKLINSNDRLKVIPFDPNPLNILAEISSCDGFIGMRYHSCMFAYLTNTPLIVIETFDKNKNLAQDIELRKNALISIKEIQNGKLGDKITKLFEYPDNFKPKISIEDSKQKSEKTLSFIINDFHEYFNDY